LDFQTTSRIRKYCDSCIPTAKKLQAKRNIESKQRWRIRQGASTNA